MSDTKEKQNNPTIIETKDLGLAAFIKTKGLKLIGCENRTFKFECEDGVSSRVDFEIAYANSCCRIHDASVMNLRQILN